MSEYFYDMSYEAKLRRYEALEQSGRLVVLPAAVGQTVWVVQDESIHEMTIEYFYCSRKPNRFFASNEYMKINFRAVAFGKYVFTSYDDAVACVIERGTHEDNA